MGKNVRVKTWEEFKALAIRKKPKNIVYIIAQGIPARNLTGLKLILPVEETQYILTDCAKGNKLRKTGISLRTDKNGNHFIEDADVKSFLTAQLQVTDSQIFSYWTI